MELIPGERGMALPLALLAIVILASLGALFAGLALTEPQVSVNFALSKQALAIADGGLEQTRAQIASLASPPNWQQAFSGLSGVQYSTGTTSDVNVADWLSIPPVTLTDAKRIRWNNMALGTGTFTVIVSSVDELGRSYSDSALFPPPNDLGQLRLVSTGTVGSGTAAVRAIIYPFSLPGPFFPAALSVKNDVELRGNSSVNGNDPDGPDVPGVYATGEVDIGGSASVSGSPNNYQDAIDDPADPNDGRSASNYFEQPEHSMTQAQLKMLVTAAKKNTSCGGPNGCYFNASQSFNPLPNGIVVVDTTDGGPITPSNHVSVSVNGTGAPSKTWLIVLGDVRIQGNISVEGMVYAFGTLNLRGFGSGTGILGAVVGLSQATVDTEVDVTGNSKIKFNLKAATIPPPGSTAYLVKAGSWRQINQ